MRRAAALQLCPWGETQAADRNFLQRLCSLRWGGSAADEALDSPGSPLFSAGTEMLLLQPRLWQGRLTSF